MARIAHGWEPALAAVAKAALSAGVLLTGFVAVSDDDYSRTVIAEQFAHEPSFDPSGTSWLPLPFWLHGAAMSVFGRSLTTAHGTALVLGVASVLCIYGAALRLGASRTGAAVSALVAAGIPTAARLGVSPQPEALVAGLVVFAAATTLVDGSARIAGGAALGAACLCRYEPWAATAAFAVLAAYDAARGPDPDARRDVRASGFTSRRHRLQQSRRTLFVAASIAVAPPLVWIVHGAVSHGDALFFLHRVAAYRRALGASEPVASSLLAYPIALLRSEPELTFAAVVALWIARRRAPEAFAALGRPAFVIASVLVFLIAGRALDGAPTHHAERTLLPVWSLFAVVVGEGAVRALTSSPWRAPRRAMARAAVVVIALAAASVALRVAFPSEPGAPRRPEREIGITARALLGPDERLLVDTRDYGYFAVIAAFGAPERAAPLDRHDPRDPASSDPFASTERLSERLRTESAAWLVVERSHLPTAAALGTVVASSGELSLVLLALR